ncbi:hypothetical protein QMK61_03930 [Fulvimonas sp. R45]|nr:hypothetical protein [Fulvimonas sp. R45]
MPRPFKVALSNVKALTDVPVLLPSILPSEFSSAIHYANGTGDKSSYEIDLYFEEGIGDAGFAGYFSGELTDKALVVGHRVALDHKITGYFIASRCGGSCSPSQIEWNVHGARYTAQLRLNVKDVNLQRETMIRIANSAIDAGPR